jgi:hypothetical protein
MINAQSSLRLALLVGLLVSIVSIAVAEPEVAEETVIFRALRDGVFTVFTDRGHGSAFLVDESGLLLTNSHVIASSSQISVQLDDTTRVSAELVAEDTLLDIAVLAVSPQVVRGRPILTLATREAGDLAFEGEEVIAIGGPLNPMRILTSGTVSKVEDRAIISDVDISPGNSGGPLINTDSEVIGINTFRDPLLGGAGVSGSLPISLAIPFLEMGRGWAQGVAPPATRLPVVPPHPYPAKGLEWAGKRSHIEDNYVVHGVPGFEVNIVTPPRRHFLETYIQGALAEEQQDHETEVGTDEDELYDPLGDDLREWREYVGDFAPLVGIAVTPKIGETDASSFLNLLGTAAGVATAVSGPVSVSFGYDAYEFQGDLQDFKLLEDDRPVQGVYRIMGTMPVPVETWSDYKDDIVHHGVFQYLPEVFGAPDSEQLHFRIVDLKNPTTEIDVKIPRKCLEQIAVDFEPYRMMLDARKTELVVGREER